MSYVKYREDDIRRNDDRLFVKNGPSLVKKELPTVFECRICHKVFDEKRTLHEHIRTSHGIVSPLVMINGKIAGKETKLSKITSARILLYEYASPIFLDNEQLLREDYGEEEEIDITDRLKDTLIRHQICCISYENTEHHIEYNPEFFLTWEKMEPIVQKWQAEVEKGRIPDYDAEAFCSGDRDFLNGMYNYYVGCISEHNKATRYDEAYDLLSTFEYEHLPEAGKCALKIIAFRRNWIRQLKIFTAMDHDIFHSVSDFFNWEPSTEEETESESESSGQLYIEDSSRRSMDLILLFQKGEYEKVKAGLAQSESADANLSNQLDFLRARLAIAEGRERDARKYADRITLTAFYKSSMEAISKMR